MFEILISISIVLAIALVGLTILYFRNKKKLLSLIVQAYAEKIVLQSQINSYSEKEEFNDKNTEFVRFLSESRESAFSYIEDVQMAIGALKFAMDSDDEDHITSAYGHLLTFLPSDNSDMVK